MQILKRNLLNSNKSKENLFKISIISDMHVIKEADRDESFPSIGRRIFYTPMTKIRQFVESVNNDTVKPDLILNLGDVINGDTGLDYDGAFDMFMGEWNKIDSSIPKAITVGNHDYTSTIPSEVNGQSRHDYIAEKLGYGSNPYIDLCKTQESFSVSGKSLDVRVINFDTNRIENGGFTSAGEFVREETMNWIESELLNCEETTIIIMTHKYRPYMDEVQVLKFEQMIADVQEVREDLEIFLFTGHSHVLTIVENYPVLGDFRIFNVPAIVDNLKSYSADFYLQSKGHLDHNKRVIWTYP